MRGACGQPSCLEAVALGRDKGSPTLRVGGISEPTCPVHCLWPWLFSQALSLPCQAVNILPWLQLIAVQLPSCVQLSVIPWTAACQASLSFSISPSLLKFMFTESMILANHLILSYPFLLLHSTFPSIKVFSMSQLFASGAQSMGASASVLLRNTQGWFPLGLTCVVSLQSEGLSRVFSSTI